MKPSLVLLIMVASGLASCASYAGRVYAGSPGSTYDATGNPPQANGAVSYDPSTPAKAPNFGNSGGAPAIVR